MTATADGLVPAASLASLDRSALAAAIRPLWEDAGPLADALVGVEVRSWQEHLRRAEAAIDAMDRPTRVALLRAHPRIGADPAALARRSATSLAEQGGASEDLAVLRRLEQANDAYESRFGFPFVAWVAGRSRAAMCEVIAARTAGEPDDELATGCAELVAIAADRLARLGNRPATSAP